MSIEILLYLTDVFRSLKIIAASGATMISIIGIIVYTARDDALDETHDEYLVLKKFVSKLPKLLIIFIIIYISLPSEQTIHSMIATKINKESVNNNATKYIFKVIFNNQFDTLLENTK
jgi:hypothetical protein